MGGGLRETSKGRFWLQNRFVSLPLDEHQYGGVGPSLSTGKKFAFYERVTQ